MITAPDPRPSKPQTHENLVRTLPSEFSPRGRSAVVTDAQTRKRRSQNSRHRSSTSTSTLSASGAAARRAHRSHLCARGPSFRRRRPPRPGAAPRSRRDRAPGRDHAALTWTSSLSPSSRARSRSQGSEDGLKNSSRMLRRPTLRPPHYPRPSATRGRPSTIRRARAGSRGPSEHARLCPVRCASALTPPRVARARRARRTGRRRLAAGSASARAAKSAARVAWSSACARRRAASLSCRYRSRFAESSLASSCSMSCRASSAPVA